MVSLVEFQDLLRELKKLDRSVLIRLKKGGLHRQTNFLRVIKVIDNAAFFMDQTTGVGIFIADLSSILEFELDGNHLPYIAHESYPLTIEATDSSSSATSLLSAS
jgi:hypothetical protein